jgi:Glycosyltransferase family 87
VTSQGKAAAYAAEAPLPSDPLRKAVTHSLAFWATVAPVWVLVESAAKGSFARDFRYAFLPAAHAILHGASPYGAAGPHALAKGTAFLYPPLSAYLFTPFTVLPSPIAWVLATALVAAAVPATLLVLGVRDWRCHAVAFLWWPTIIAIQTANVTLAMVLALALAWRYRDRPLIVALTLGFVVALKPFLWPVLVWLPATRRYRGAVLAAAASAALVLVPWAGIGFAGMRSYPRLLSSVSRLEGVHSYSLPALLHVVLPNWTAATVVGMGLGAGVLLVALTIGWRGRDRDAFALAVVATLLVTPLVEIHYFALLLVVVALYRRRLALAWLSPLLIWGASAANAATVGQDLHVLVVVAATVLLAMSDRRPIAGLRLALPGHRA